MSDDLMRRLRAADPAARVADVAPDAAMRDAILATDPGATAGTPAARPRRAPRGLVVGVLATVLAGGGAAYAAIDWRKESYVDGGHEGVTCLLTWDGPREERSGGPLVSGDPIADCRSYQDLTGGAAIPDPVAFTHEGWLYVGPRDEVPEGADLVEPDPQDVARRELEASLDDLVDGPRTSCLDEAGALAAARAELDRLGLDDWTVRVEERDPDRPAEPCARIAFAWDEVPAQSENPLASPGTVTDVPVPRTLAVTPHADRRFEDWWAEMDPGLVALRETLRERVAATCVDLDEAERITAETLGDGHHWPTVALEDPTAECTRIHLTSGGSVQVSLYGPRG